MEQSLWDKGDNTSWEREKERERGESMGEVIEPMSCKNSKS